MRNIAMTSRAMAFCENTDAVTAFTAPQPPRALDSRLHLERHYSFLPLILYAISMANTVAISDEQRFPLHEVQRLYAVRISLQLPLGIGDSPSCVTATRKIGLI
jgi:hypothetical protein